jgi:hypothetical protein
VRKDQQGMVAALLRPIFNAESGGQARLHRAVPFRLDGSTWTSENFSQLAPSVPTDRLLVKGRAQHTTTA